MKVVIVASEAVPFAKTGGLADVAGALPAALDRLGHEVTLVLPCYRRAWKAGIPFEATGLTLRVPVGPKIVEGHVHSCRLPGSNARALLIDQPGYFDRDQLYGRDGVDYPDNCERFVFFARATLEAVRLLDLRPDVVHCNDWQAGLIPVYLDEIYRHRPGFAGVGTLMTVHNLAYQGAFWHWDMPLTDLDWRLFHWQALEFHGRLNFLKAGLVFADLLSTVSPTYAREIQTPEFGCGLDGLLRARGGDLHGIVNGIDPSAWSPVGDRFVLARYNAETVAGGKAACKGQLQRRAGLPERLDVPLFAQIGRLDPQKGWDLLAGVADDLLKEDVQLVILGEGQPRYHELVDRLADRYPGKIRAFLEFSNVLAHQIEAGADAFLMPSLYEPCGLNQLYSLAYGTVPIVRATGGLADTVVDATPEALADGTATGFAFREATPRGLRAAIDRALALWADPAAWERLAMTGMQADWSWDRSAAAYAALYDEIRRRRSARAAG
ncbi:MAG TPA: glycogen synthase GlgA [Isosphaeraceae bacterium]|jgi:starch synthase|nr:glycogen synthase GlgA [Isosphaeraceae bacterium]